ncbi:MULTISPECIES: hypothetical protein [unclassified Nostoc]|uniref:hypothetical protein n=1 Tax=unclassified Nostoc TaxID=2593658 RepID=UPI001F5517AD|nr:MULTISPECIES: hypothetical protein [unclassified Nostoc]
MLTTLGSSKLLVPTNNAAAKLRWAVPTPNTLWVSIPGPPSCCQSLRITRLTGRIILDISLIWIIYIRRELVLQNSKAILRKNPCYQAG